LRARDEQSIVGMSCAFAFAGLMKADEQWLLTEIY
jgi:hypothetical protein